MQLTTTRVTAKTRARFQALWFDEKMVADWRLTLTSADRTAARYAVSHHGITGAGQLPLATIQRIVTTGS